ncbi:MAG: hypothetical protein ACI96M_002941 [Candidatus Azotimanducaceae bacterium]|jgi:hypothetical protein
MSKSFEIQGLIHSIGETTEYGQNGFTKREFVIKLTGEGENSDYPNYIALELIKDKCALMDRYQINDEISAQFNLSGRLWSGNGKPEKCFNSLQAWKVDSMGPAQSGDMQEPPPGDYSQNNPDFDDDIPF